MRINIFADNDPNEYTVVLLGNSATIASTELDVSRLIVLNLISSLNGADPHQHH